MQNITKHRTPNGGEQKHDVRCTTHILPTIQSKLAWMKWGIKREKGHEYKQQQQQKEKKRKKENKNYSCKITIGKNCKWTNDRINSHIV